MKNLTKLKSNVYSSTSVDVVSRNMINRQMYHHYRRVLSARKIVDSSPPFAYRHLQATRQGRKPHQSGPEEGDSKKCCIVTEMFKLSCGGGRRACSELDVQSPPSPVYATPQKKNCSCPDMMVNGRQNVNNRSGVKSAEHCGAGFTRPAKLFRPVILRRDAESKVRGLRVYHPPRKRPGQHEKGTADLECVDVTSGESSARSTATRSREPWASTVQLPSVGACFCGTAKSKVSSCDSAYNGGGTSSAAESGSSSPARRQILARDSSYLQFMNGTGRKDVASQTENGDVASDNSVDRGEDVPSNCCGFWETTAPDERRKWNFTDLYLYPDPFDDDVLLEECMRDMKEMNLSVEDSYPWSDVPSLSGELFV